MMDADTLIALKGSIAKWEAIVAGTGMDNGAENCPLCQLFNNEEADPEQEDCKGCPVAVATLHQYCRGTPYYDYVRFQTPPHAQRELDFLRSLLPTEAA